ncbi:MAG: hypothetical protein CL804_03495 [Citromicrobium sp.]|nr:hypothetical protein [Citromicrobium sp.]
MCISAPEVPEAPQRQAAKLPTGNTPQRGGDKLRRRAIMAGLVTNPNGLGNPQVTNPTLG